VRHLVWVVASAAFASGLIGAWAFTHLTGRSAVVPGPVQPQTPARLRSAPDRSSHRRRERKPITARAR
jgi:hypothetical protein